MELRYCIYIYLYQEVIVLKPYPPKICPLCKQSFVPNSSRQIVCNKDHYYPCPDCGQPVKMVEKSYSMFLKTGPKRCKACATKLASQKRKNKSDVEKLEISNKRKQTNLQRYGVEYASQSNEIQEKIKSTNQKLYGVDRPLQNKTIYENMQKSLLEKYGVDNVSKLSETTDKIQQSTFDHYGVQSALQSEELQGKMRNTMKLRYGCENAMQVDQLKHKYQESMLSHHGVYWPQQSSEIKDKTVRTNQERYGVENVSQNLDIRHKISSTNLEKYGVENVLQNHEVQDKIRETNLERYGVPYPMMNDNIKHKAIVTNRERYGVDYHIQDINTIKRMIVDPEKYQKYYLFRNDPCTYIMSNFDHKPTVVELCNQLGCTDTPIYQILNDHDCMYLISKTISSMEYEVLEYLKETLDVEIIHNCRSVISPLELDFYVPELKFAVECNPTVTHNSSLIDPWGQNPKSPSYHKIKSDMCEKRGIFLFHIFGYEWTYRKDIIKSMLCNLLHKTSNKIYARNTYVCDINYEECCEFLNHNHRQGMISASIRLGLRSKSTHQLLSVMTFNRTRSSIGSKTSFNGYELSRFCNKIGTCVVGGASKLFKHFLDLNLCDHVVSFSDKAHTRGELYKKLGFHEVSLTQPGYVWVSILDDSYYTRVQCQKRNLRKLFNDETIDIENKTEREIMIEHGYVQVFDSGVIRWEYDKIEC